MHNPWNVNSDLALNTSRITQSKATDVDLSSNANNLSLRHAGSKVPIGSLFVTRPTLGLEGSSLSIERIYLHNKLVTPLGISVSLSFSPCQVNFGRLPDCLSFLACLIV